MSNRAATILAVAAVVSCSLCVSGIVCAGDQPRTPKGDGTQEPQSRARLDRYGDPLPLGCISRLGSQRLRHTSRVMRVAWSADGRKVASWSYDGVLALWDAQTGELIERWSLPGFDVYHRVHCLEFLPDGRSLAVMEDRNGVVYLWDFAAGEPAPTPSEAEEEGPSKRFVRFAVSPNRRLLAGASARHGASESTIQIWELRSGKRLSDLNEVCHFDWRGRSSSWLGFTADDDLISVFAGLVDERESQLVVWDVATGQQLRDFAAPEMGLTRKSSNGEAAVTPDGSLIAIRTPENVIEVIDLNTGERQHRLFYSRPKLPLFSEINAVAISGDGQRLACGGSDGQMKVWNLRTGERLRTLTHGEWVECVAFSRDGESLVSGGRDHVVRLWSIATGEQTPELDAHESRLTAMAVSADGTQVATATADGTVYLWDTHSGQLLRKGSLGEVWADKLAFSPDGSYLAVATRDERAVGTPGDWRAVIRVWDAENWTELRRLGGHSGAVECVFFSPDSRLLISGDYHEAFIVWEASTGTTVRGLRLERSASLRACALAPDGNTLAVGVSRRAADAPHDAIRLLDLNTGERIREIRLEEGSIDVLAFSPDGRTIAAGGHPRYDWWEPSNDEEQARAGFPNALRIWNATKGELVRKMPLDPNLLNGSARRVVALAFSPDGKRLFAAEESGTIRSFDAESGELECSLSGHSAAVRFLATAGESNVLVSGCQDDLSVLVWEIETLGGVERSR